MKNSSLIYILIIVLSILIGIFTRIQLYDKYNITSGDSLEHYYHMRKNYDNKEFPVMGVYLVSPRLLIGSESVYEENVPRIPGGLFYLQYIYCIFCQAKILR